MAKGGMPKELALVLACGALAWDVAQARKHQRTCPQCARRDLLAIALDVGHLIQAA